MSGVSVGDTPNSFGTPSQIAVTRALAEFHARRPLQIVGKGGGILALPVDGLDQNALDAFRRLCTPAPPRLVVTAERARAIGIETAGAVALEIDRYADPAAIMALAAASQSTYSGFARAPGAPEQAAIELAKLSQGLPSVLIARVEHTGRSREFEPVAIEAAAVEVFAGEIVNSLVIASRASIPLASGERSEFVVFRDALGGTSTAIIIGKPDVAQPVLVRLHSACLTGDVFGSRRCDCGDQLKLGVKRIEAAGAGVILYLPQEGRGVGLANKMRAYQKQDEGLDTVDANTSLGFEDDERDYRMAGRMLQMLGCRNVVLLTNNPAKLEGLAQAGIEIAGRMPIETPVNADNLRYMRAKAARAGHQLDHMLAGLGQATDSTESAPAA
jgi:GTP cyclohydrolase II